MKNVEFQIVYAHTQVQTQLVIQKAESKTPSLLATARPARGAFAPNGIARYCVVRAHVKERCARSEPHQHDHDDRDACKAEEQVLPLTEACRAL